MKNTKQLMVNLTILLIVFVAVMLAFAFTACNNDTVHSCSFGEWETKTPATCIAAKVEKRTCSCGKEETQNVGEPLVHIWEFIEGTGQEPTCLDDGHGDQECTLCGEIKEDVDIDALGHDLDWRERTAPICEVDGVDENYCKRDNCDHIETTTKPIAALEHDPQPTENIYQQPTCTQKGYGELECTRCGQKTAGGEIPPRQHDFPNNWSVRTPANCTTAGVEEKVCQRPDCDDKEDTGTQAQSINALGHDFTVWGNSTATCTVAGTETRTCTLACGLVGHTETRAAAALGHLHTDYVTNNNATCLIDSTETAICDRNDCTEPHTRTKAETALGHSFIAWGETRAATCTVENQETRTCTRDCGETGYTETRSTITALGHSYGNWTVTTPAGFCVDGTHGNGIETLMCLRFAQCGAINGTRPISCLGTEGLNISGGVVNGIGTATGGVLCIPNYHSGQEVVSIGTNAFQFNSTLTSITIPASVTSIANNSFFYCTSLATVTFAPGSQLQTIGAMAFNNNTSLASITIPASVITIGEQVFIACNNLENVFFANGSQLQTIEGWAFASTSSLAGIIIPASVTSIGNNAFESSGLSNVTFAEGSQLHTIGEWAFAYCTALKSIMIPASVTSIGDTAFSNCENLESVTIPAGITTIGEWTFADCTSLTTVNFASGSQLQTIGEWAFAGCTDLVNITIPSSVTSIDERAFTGCTSLTTVNFASGSQLQIIGDYAFQGCASITLFSITATTPPTLGVTVFQNHDDDIMRIVVPVNSAASYRTATRWSAGAIRRMIHSVGCVKPNPEWGMAPAGQCDCL